MNEAALQLIPATAGSWGLHMPNGSYITDKAGYLLLVLCLYTEVLAGTIDGPIIRQLTLEFHL